MTNLDEIGYLTGITQKKLQKVDYVAKTLYRSNREESSLLLLVQG